MHPGTFIVNNYKQALNIIDKNTPIIEASCLRLKIVEADFDKYFNEEHVYICSLKAEQMENPLHISYVNALKNLAVRK
jgi:hypothetical protein